MHAPHISTQKTIVNSEGFLAEVFHPWERWEGPGILDLRIRPAPPAAASGNPGYTDLAPLGLRSKNKVFERPGLSQVKSFGGKISSRVRRY